MSEFKVRPQNVRAASQDMNEIARKMRSLESEILKIQDNLSFEIAQKQRIRQRLKTARNSTASHYKKIYSSTSTLNNIINTYEITERRLAGAKAPGVGMIFDHLLDNIRDVISFGPESGFGGGSWGSGSPVVPSLVGPGALTSKLPDLLSGNTDSEIKYGTGSFDLGSRERDNKIPFYQKNKEELKDSKKKPFKVIDQKWSYTESAIHEGTILGSKDGSHISAEADVFKREIYAEIYGGLYYKDPQSGEKKLRMTAGVSCGATITAFSTSAEAMLGNSNFGVYGKGNIDIGKVEGKADAVVGLRDAKGNFNPTVYAKASAEAIAAEISGKAGGKILGTDVGVKGSVNFGIGAHFEAGLKDGVFSVDVGASLGIGGSVKLEVDVSGTVKAAMGYAESAWNKLTGWFSK